MPRITPLQVLFVVLVLGLLVKGIVDEHGTEKQPSLAFGVLADTAPEFDKLEIPLGPHELNGRVLTAEGEPVHDVEVLLYRSAATESSAEPLHITFTDEVGAFALDELMATEYGVVLHAPGYAPQVRTLSIPEVSRVDWRLETPLEPIEFLPEMRRADLVGSVRASDATRDLGGYEVSLVPAQSTHRLSGALPLRTQTDAFGDFRFEAVVAADYELRLLPAWAAGGSWPVLDRLAITHAPDLERNLVLELDPGSIVGRVVESRAAALNDSGDGTLPPEPRGSGRNGESAENGQAVAGRPIEGALIQVRSAEDPSRLWPPIASDAEGRFLVEHLPAGRYLVRVHAGQAVREHEVSVPEGGRVPLGVIRLTPSP